MSTLEGYDAFVQPNVQVALNAYLAGPERQADLVGVGANNMPSWPSSPT